MKWQETAAGFQQERHGTYVTGIFGLPFDLLTHPPSDEGDAVLTFNSDSFLTGGKKGKPPQI